jgi:hypothetical protein
MTLFLSALIKRQQKSFIANLKELQSNDGQFRARITSYEMNYSNFTKKRQLNRFIIYGKSIKNQP